MLLLSHYKLLVIILVWVGITFVPPLAAYLLAHRLGASRKKAASTET